ncbi:MAG: T9SS type A sorting domain-containing protein [Bacteroidales bacterium]|nr:T9SS type A sorting domain-containing protein [Bacteroidales bacterium]
MDNIDAGTISDLYIYENNLLSTCDVQSVCDYLTDPNGDIYIYNNDLGCNNVGQVFIHCFSGFVEHNKLENEFSTFPNPFTKSATLEIVLQEPGTVEIKIYGQMGQLLKTIVRECRIAGKQKIALETKNLPAGVYFCVLKTNEGIQTTKIIKL